jgi:inorganic pyrophosphatase
MRMGAQGAGNGPPTAPDENGVISGVCAAHGAASDHETMHASAAAPAARRARTVPAGPYNRRAMSLDRVPAGRDLPNDCNVVIEIPMHGEAIKYEVDKETGAVFVDRFMSTAMHYPCNYGYIPQTLSDDGDPCDVLVISPVPLITGVVVRCRPIGMLKMDDEAGGDAKILAVPIDRLSSLYRAIESPRDLPEIQLAQIAHFFEHYKDLEPGKWVRLAGWVGPEEAKREIMESAARHRGAGS